MKRYNLENISFAIHIRIDIPERLQNLETVLDYYHSTCDNCEFVIINDDKEPDSRLRSIYDKYKKNNIFLFLQNDDIYRRPLSFNKAFCNSTRPLMIAGDTDVIIHPRYLVKAGNMILGGECNHIYPYNGLFTHVKEHIRDKFKANFDFDILSSVKPIHENRYPYYENEDILVAHHQSRGGCIMYESQMFKDINGYNPKFRGWGYEDDEIFNRLIKLGYKSSRVLDDDAVAWHLPHPDTVRDDHPYYEDNRLLSNFVDYATPEQLKKYIKTWKLE